MLFKKTGFTLIELIITIAIITIVSASGTLYFFGFVESQQMKSKIDLFVDTIKALDTEVENYEIFDYKITFSDQENNNKSMTIEKNIFDTPYETSLTLNDNSYEINISSDASGTDIWDIRVYADHKIISELSEGGDENITLKLSTTQNYHIYSQINGDNIGSNHIYYFEPPTEEGYLRLIGIYTSEDQTTQIVAPISMVNIRGKKTFSPDPGVTSIYLLFEYNGREILTPITTY